MLGHWNEHNSVCIGRIFVAPPIHMWKPHLSNRMMWYEKTSYKEIRAYY